MSPVAWSDRSGRGGGRCGGAITILWCGTNARDRRPGRRAKRLRVALPHDGASPVRREHTPRRSPRSERIIRRRRAPGHVREPGGLPCSTRWRPGDRRSRARLDADRGLRVLSVHPVVVTIAVLAVDRPPSQNRDAGGQRTKAANGEQAAMTAAAIRNGTMAAAATTFPGKAGRLHLRSSAVRRRGNRSPRPRRCPSRPSQHEEDG